MKNHLIADCPFLHASPDRPNNSRSIGAGDMMLVPMQVKGRNRLSERGLKHSCSLPPRP